MSHSVSPLRVIAATIVGLTLASCDLIFPYASGDGSSGADRPSDHRVADGRVETSADGTHDAPPPLPAPCTPTGAFSWCWAHPRPHGNQLHGVWGDKASVFVVGEGGSLQRFDRVTLTWTQEWLGSGWRAVSGRSSTEVYAVGDEGAIARYNGSTWQPEKSPTLVALNGVWGDATGVYAVGADGTLAQKTGTTWTATTIASDATLYSVSGAAGTLYVTGRQAAPPNTPRIYRRPPADAWQLVGPTASLPKSQARILGVWGGDASNVFFAGEDGQFLWLQGSTFTGLTPGAYESLVGVGGVWTATMQLVLAVGPETAATSSLFTFDNLQGSLTRDVLPIRGARAVWIDDVPERVVTGAGGSILRGVKTPTLEHPQLVRTTQDLHGVWGDSQQILAVGDQGTILRSTDGQGWTAMPVTTTQDLRAVWGPDGPASLTPLVAIAVGSAGTILTFNGSAWSPVTPSPTTADLRAIWGSGPSDIFVVGDAVTTAGTPACLHYDGTRWSPMPLPASTVGSLSDVWGSGPNDVWAVGEGGLVLHHDGSTWKPGPAFGAKDLYAVGGLGPQQVFVGSYDSIYRLDPAGWIPEASYGEIHGFWGRPGGALYAVGVLGQVLVRTKGSWTLQATSAGNDLADVWGYGPTVWTVGAAGAILYHHE
jgi:hypothetical protein